MLRLLVLAAVSLTVAVSAATSTTPSLSLDLPTPAPLPPPVHRPDAAAELLAEALGASSDAGFALLTAADVLAAAGAVARFPMAGSVANVVSVAQLLDCDYDEALVPSASEAIWVWGIGDGNASTLAGSGLSTAILGAGGSIGGGILLATARESSGLRRAWASAGAAATAHFAGASAAFAATAAAHGDDPGSLAAGVVAILIGATGATVPLVAAVLAERVEVQNLTGVQPATVDDDGGDSSDGSPALKPRWPESLGAIAHSVWPVIRLLREPNRTTGRVVVFAEAATVVLLGLLSGLKQGARNCDPVTLLACLALFLRLAFLVVVRPFAGAIDAWGAFASAALQLVFAGLALVWHLGLDVRAAIPGAAAACVVAAMALSAASLYQGLTEFAEHRQRRKARLALAEAEAAQVAAEEAATVPVNPLANVCDDGTAAEPVSTLLERIQVAAIDEGELQPSAGLEASLRAVDPSLDPTTVRKLAAMNPSLRHALLDDYRVVRAVARGEDAPVLVGPAPLPPAPPRRRVPEPYASRMFDECNL